LAVALGTHVLGIILAIVGMSLGASFWAILASNCADAYSYNSYYFDPSSRIKRDGYCSCFYHDTTYGHTCKSLILFILSTSLNFPPISALQSRGILQAMLKFNYVVLLDAASCSDLKTVREATGAVTIFFALFTIVSFVGSIYGCIGTCCTRRVNYAWYIDIYLIYGFSQKQHIFVLNRNQLLSSQQVNNQIQY
jgi:hypothetical protein